MVKWYKGDTFDHPSYFLKEALFCRAGKLPLYGSLAPRHVLGAVPHRRFRLRTANLALRVHSSTADFNLLPKSNSFGSTVPKTINESSLSYYEEGF